MCLNDTQSTQSRSCHTFPCADNENICKDLFEELCGIHLTEIDSTTAVCLQGTRSLSFKNLPFPYNKNVFENICGIALTKSDPMVDPETGCEIDCFRGEAPRCTVYCDRCFAESQQKVKMYRDRPKDIELDHLPVGTKPCKVVIRQCGLRCPVCGRYFAPPLPCQFLTFSITKDLALRVLELSNYSYTDRAIAFCLGLSEERVTRILDAWVAWYAWSTKKLLEAKIREKSLLNGNSADLSLPRVDKTTSEENTNKAALDDGFAAYRLAETRKMLSQYAKELVTGDECAWPSLTEMLYELEIDEVSAQGREFYTVFMNRDHNILFYAKGRGKDTVKKFVHWAGDMLAPDLHVVADMHAPFLSAIRELLPHCIVTTDWFHKFEHLNEDVADDLVQRSKELSSDEVSLQKILKDPNFHCMICQKAELSEQEQELLKEVGKKVPEVFQVREIVELSHKAHQTFLVRDKNEMERLLTQVLIICHQLQMKEGVLLKFRKAKKLEAFVEKVCPTSTPESKQELPLALQASQKILPPNTGKRLYPMAHFGQMIVNHWESVCNFAVTGMSTGLIEGYNNLFKSLKHAKYGIKKLIRYMNRFKLIAAWKRERHVKDSTHRAYTYLVQNQADWL